MDIQQDVSHCKDLVHRLREQILLLFKDEVTDLKPLQKLILGIRAGMRHVQRKTEELKENCVKVRDETDVLQLEVENANYLRAAYQESIERAEREPTPQLHLLRIDPEQDSASVKHALETEREVTITQTRIELMRELEAEESDLHQVKALHLQLSSKLQRFQQLALSVQTAAEALKSFTSGDTTETSS